MPQEKGIALCTIQKYYRVPSIEEIKGFAILIHCNEELLDDPYIADEDREINAELMVISWDIGFLFLAIDKAYIIKLVQRAEVKLNGYGK
ncbi:hypothetical protein MAM1_0129c06084 [Mucor ambiguus]|uniref:Uncharacterized protein n=1 Tax=Mucor ambiguus TaxID=91626 RepID=A0A0C9MT69_9FUNG|nr:hypothetical protein MAM1_0129c06084 [Mucor ambiguus]